MLTLRDKILLVPLWLIAHLPLFVQYGIARFFYFIVFYLVGYRKKVVESNLRNSFPEKTDQEIKAIIKGFYKHLVDIFIETLYLLSMSGEEVKKRYKIVNPEIINDLYAKNKDVIVVLGHYGNWEWGCSGELQLPYSTIGVYKPLSNKMFDRFMRHIRTVYGTRLIPMKDTLRTIVGARKNNDRFLLYLIGDQRPQKSEIQHWLTFLNQETPVITGPEKLAKKFGAAVLFMDIVQKKRGYYELVFRTITEEPAETKVNEITDKYFQLIEEQIKRQPELYLWSHKRWKFNRTDFE